MVVMVSIVRSAQVLVTEFIWSSKTAALISREYELNHFADRW